MAQPKRRTGRSTSVAFRSVPDAVTELARGHCSGTIRAAFIRHFADTNGLSASCLRACPTAAARASLANIAEIESVRRNLRTRLPTVTIKNLEAAFEALLSLDHRRSKGAVYTPDFIIDYLLSEALANADTGGRIPEVCDPACGSAGFLLRAARLLASRYDLTYADAFARYVTGVDNDPLALEHARCLIELFLASHQSALRAGDLRLLRADTLLSPPEELRGLAVSGDGFDVLATNPPYVKLQNLDPSYRRQLLGAFNGFARGSYSLAILFLIAGHRLLRPGGCLAAITQNNLFTSLAGEPVRRYLQDNGALRRVLDFGHNHVFENASAYTCLVFLGTERQASFQFDSLDPPITAAALRGADFSEIRVDDLQVKKWRLARRHHLENIHRIESIGQPLGSIAAIRVGFATLKDAVFLLGGDNGGCLARDVDGVAREIERGVTRRAVKVAEVTTPGQLRDNRRRVIFPYVRVDGTYRVIPEDELRRRFPVAYEHLLACRDALHSRDKGRRRSAAWYAWGRSQGREAPGPKLLTKTFNAGPNFLLDESDQLFCNGYSVSLRMDREVAPYLSIETLRRVLNSTVMHYYARLTSFQIEGGYECYQKNFIERFGIPRLTAEQGQRIASLPSDDADALVTALYDVSGHHLAEILDGGR